MCNVWAAPDLGSGRRPAAERALKKALRTQRVVLVHVALTLDGPHPRRSGNQIRYAALKRRWQSVSTSRSGAAQIYIPGDVVTTTCTYCRRRFGCDSSCKGGECSNPSITSGDIKAEFDCDPTHDPKELPCCPARPLTNLDCR